MGIKFSDMAMHFKIAILTSLFAILIGITMITGAPDPSRET